MTIEKAFSLEMGEIIDVETAYDLFWAGLITDKRNFECAHVDCDAPITAANLDKLRQDMKVDPYYKYPQGSRHCRDCPFDKDTPTNPAKASPDTTDASSRQGRRVENAMADIFEFQRPDSHFTNLRHSQGQDAWKDPVEKRKRKKRATTSSSMPRPSTHYSLMSFVSKYHRYLRDGETQSRLISAKGKSLSYSQMFIRVEGQPLHELPRENRIYYGEATVKKLESGDYRIKFSQPFVHDEKQIPPSIYISKDMIEAAFSRRLTEAKFNELSARKISSVWVFVYSCPNPKNKTIDGKELTFVNFPLYNLDLFDFRENFYEQLD